MGDIRKRMASVRARWLDGDPAIVNEGIDALERAMEYFGAKDKRGTILPMAAILFGPRDLGRAKGAKTWNNTRKGQLLRAYQQMKRKHPRMSDAKIATALCKDFKSDAEVLRQRISQVVREYTEWEERDRDPDDL
jgi:hypothetical protein